MANKKNKAVEVVETVAKTNNEKAITGQLKKVQADFNTLAAQYAELGKEKLEILEAYTALLKLVKEFEAKWAEAKRKPIRKFMLAVTYADDFYNAARALVNEIKTDVNAEQN